MVTVDMVMKVTADITEVVAGIITGKYTFSLHR